MHSLYLRWKDAVSEYIMHCFHVKLLKYILAIFLLLYFYYFYTRYAMTQKWTIMYGHVKENSESQVCVAIVSIHMQTMIGRRNQKNISGRRNLPIGLCSMDPHMKMLRESCIDLNTMYNLFKPDLLWPKKIHGWIFTRCGCV